MKKSKRDQIYNIDEFEDLTLFANESFDTQDVDLFEFTSEESSPLTRLKSIILSLDWEITDEILQELADEVANLESVYQGDKVAEVYLQGLDKIGSYIRSKGAYAHPNAIKLLLTFFYDFEKTVSSPDLSGEEITRILKADIRKFKILQYQIALGEDGGAPPAAPTVKAAAPPVIESGGDHRRLLKAAILSLDWEVTEESLGQYTDNLAQYRDNVTGNRLALVLVQGLQALGEYIGEQRAEAHPEAFALLHSFNEALEQITDADATGLEDQRAREIITKQINRLNHLKLLIAAPGQAAIDEARIDEVVGAISEPAAAADVAENPFTEMEEPDRDHGAALAEAFPIELEEADSGIVPADRSLAEELDSLFDLETKPAMESADVQYPDEILPPEAIRPVDDELADDLIEASLHTKRGLAPALSGADELPVEREERDLPAEGDLAEQLDLLFAEADSQSDTAAAAMAATRVSELALDSDSDDGPVAALADAEEPPGRLDLEGASPAGLDLDATLDSFFTEPAAAPAAATVGEDEPAPAEAELFLDLDLDRDRVPTETVQAEAAKQPETDLAAVLPPESFDLDDTLDILFTEPNAAPADDQAASVALTLDEDEEEVLLSTPAGDGEPVAALNDAEEPNFVEALGLEEVGAQTGVDDIESRLDSFFSEAADEPGPPARETVPVEEIEQSLFFAEDRPVTAALADTGEERGFSEEEALAELDFTPIDEIEEKLDFFFGEDEQPAEEPSTIKPPQPVGVGTEAPLETLLADLPAAPFAAAPTEEEAGGDLVDHDLERQLDFFLEASDDDEEEPAAAAVDDLTQALEATIDAERLAAPAAGLGLAAATAPSGVEREASLATLGALLPGVVRSPSREQLTAARAQAAVLRGLTDEPGQRALVDLLGAVIGLLGRTAGQQEAGTGALVNFLYERLLRGDGGPATLAEAVGRYAGWMAEVCARMPLVPALRETGAAEPQFEYTARDLYVELSELRAGMRDELARLRHEMQHLQQHH